MVISVNVKLNPSSKVNKKNAKKKKFDKKQNQTQNKTPLPKLPHLQKKNKNKKQTQTCKYMADYFEFFVRFSRVQILHFELC